MFRKTRPRQVLGFYFEPVPKKLGLAKFLVVFLFIPKLGQDPGMWLNFRIHPKNRLYDRRRCR